MTAIVIILSLLVIATSAAAWKAQRRADEAASRLDESRIRLEESHSQLDELRKHLEESQARNEESHKRLDETLASHAEEKSRLTAQIATLNERVEQYRSRSENDEKERKDREDRFKILATEILNANTRIIKEQHEDRLDAILKPLRDNIDDFRKSVTDCYNNEARERFSLMKSVEELIKTNTSIGNEARELAQALRGDSKVQGDWGELILENILEKSGLRPDEEFSQQVTRDASGNVLRDEAGHLLRPDVVVKYPGGRCVIIDSKVSLTAYVDYINSSDPDERDKALSRHVASVRSHIKELATKKYQDYVGDGKTDFVMMFIPNESAYIAAMQAVPSLWQEAYDERVLIVSPTHLVSALKLISQLWDRDRQTRNAVAIADQAGKLYDKFADFIADLDSIGKGIANTQKALDAARNKLTDGNGNLLKRVEKLRELGAKARKQLPSPESE